MNTHELEAWAGQLGIDASREDMEQLRERVAFVAEFAKRFKAMADARTIEWIEHNGDLEVGEVRYYVGDRKDTSVKNKAATLDAVFIATGGDVGQVAELLSSDPFKHGACREFLGDKWGDHFVVESKPALKDGKPVKSLQSINPKFLRGGTK